MSESVSLAKGKQPSAEALVPKEIYLKRSSSLSFAHSYLLRGYTKDKPQQHIYQPFSVIGQNGYIEESEFNTIDGTC